MRTFFKFTVTFLLAAMTTAAIFMLIHEPKEIGSYTAIALCLFFDIVCVVGLYYKNSKLYKLLHDQTLGEEKNDD